MLTHTQTLTDAGVPGHPSGAGLARRLLSLRPEGDIAGLSGQVTR
jgi:hypothetical protein